MFSLLRARDKILRYQLGRVKRIWYLSPMRAAKFQASLRIRAVSPEPSLLAHTSRESRGTFRQKTRSLAHLNGWACAVKICHDGMLEDTNSPDAAQFVLVFKTSPVDLWSSSVSDLKALYSFTDNFSTLVCLYPTTWLDECLKCSQTQATFSDDFPTWRNARLFNENVW